MSSKPQSIRQQTHSLLDVLPEEKVAVVHDLLEIMLDPYARALANAPYEDEEISEEEERDAAESREWLKHNKAILNEEVLKEFGLTPEDFERMGRTPISPEPRKTGQ